MESFNKIASEKIGEIKPGKSKKERYIEEIKAQFIELRCPICNSLYELERITQYHLELQFTCFRCDKNKKGCNDYHWVTVILRRSLWRKKWKISRVTMSKKKKEEDIMLENGEKDGNEKN